MGDAVLRIRSRLQSLARDNWSEIEEKHVHNVTWLQDELAQIARSLEIKARFAQSKPVIPTSFPRCEDDAFDVSEPTRKKQKIETHREDAAYTAGKRNDERRTTRMSMRLRSREASADITSDAGVKRTRKRGRPSEMLLQSPSKLKVVDLRFELKKRGLSTCGVKAVLYTRLLDALRAEQKENNAHLHKAKKIVEEEQERGVAVIGDDSDDDEIVRESVGSNKSLRNVVASQSTSDEKESAVSTTVVGDEQHGSLLLALEDVPNADRALQTVEMLSVADTAPEVGAAVQPQHTSKSDLASPTGTSRGGIMLTTDNVEELITHDVLKVARKSMQIGGKSELTSPLAWKRKSILRKASSLAPRTQGFVRNVSFAPTDKVNVTVDSSQNDTTQPDPSPEKTLSLVDSPTHEEKRFADPDPSMGDKQKLNTGSTVEASSISPQNPLTQAVSEQETEEQRKKREFEETVQREAQKLRLAAKLSAQKRIEEAKASKALWAKGGQLKATLRASSAGDGRKSARTSLSVTSKSAIDQVSPRVSGSSTGTKDTFAALDTNRLTASASKSEIGILHTTHLATDEAKGHSFMQLVVRKQEAESISDVAPGFESSVHDSQATYSMVDDKHKVERSMSHRLLEKPAAKSMPAVERMLQESPGNHSTRLDIASQKSQPPSSVSLTTLRKDTNKSDPLKMQTVEPLLHGNRLGSLSSTVSSIPDTSIVEDTAKLGTVTAANGGRVSNLVSGLHSFTTLLERNNAQETNSSRSTPVVNALKLAEKSRVLEEKKKLEKERRKAILKKRIEEHKVAALKEKAEKDAQAKREQERLNVRKKREAELARQRQQKLKEMRAGLEKKRAMLAAEKNAFHASSTASASKLMTSSTMASHHKHHGLASTSGAATKLSSRPLQKPVLNPISKPGSNLPLTSKPVPKPVAKPVPRSTAASPVPAKHDPKNHSPEVMNYEMSDNAESVDGDSSDSDADRHGKKKVPRWAQKDHLNKVLRAQFGKNAIDPSPAIFQDFVDTCNLEAIFETTDIRKKKKFTRRTSSGNWLADRPTARDKALYQRDMGYDQ